MTINLADNDPRNEYTVSDGNSQTVFTMDFEIFDNADLNVYVDGVLQTLTTHYKISDVNNNANAGHTSGTDGFVHFTSAVTASGSDKEIVLTRSIALQRTTDFPSAGPFDVGSLNTELDRITAIQADLKDDIDRSLRLTDFDVDATLTLPAVDARKGKTLAFNATSGAVEAGPSISDVQTVSAAAADIQTVAHLQDGTTTSNGISTLAGISSNISTVASIGVTAMANVSGKATEIGLLGTTAAVADMAILGTTAVVADMDILANVSTDITTLAHIEDGTTATNAIQTVATNISSVQSAQANAAAAEAARDSAKAIAAAMGAALDNFDDRYLGTMADNASATTSFPRSITAPTGSADVTVPDATGIVLGMKVTSASIPAGTNVIGISGTTISLDNAATATGSAPTTTFSVHGVYAAFNTSTDGPSTDNDGDALVTGALYFNTTDNEMRVYDGANWIAASAAGSASMNIFEYTVSGSPTATFSGADDNTATLSYTQGNIQVVKDGVVLHADDFTATNGTSVVLQSNAAVGSEIVIYAFKSFTVADTVSKSSGGNFLSNIQINGADVATTGKAIAMAIVFGG